jgi:hypothetical protein
MEELRLSVLYPHLWVLPKCFDTLSICALGWLAPPLSLSWFGFRFPHALRGEVPRLSPPEHRRNISVTCPGEGRFVFLGPPQPCGDRTTWLDHGVDHQRGDGATLGLPWRPEPGHRPGPAGLARRRVLLGACPPLIGPGGNQVTTTSIPPYIKWPARKFFQKIIQPVFVPEKRLGPNQKFLTDF